MRILIVVAVASWMTASTVSAQPGEPAPPGSEPAPPPPPGPPAPVMVPPPPPTPEVHNIDKGTLEDANAGRAWLSPTALTPPAGTWSFEDYELFILGASYAVTDQFVISANAMVPITSDFYWGLLSAKLQAVRSGNLRIAVQGAVSSVYVRDTGTNSSVNDTVSGGELGGAATYCLDPDCHSHLTGFVGAGFAFQKQSSYPLLVSGAVVVKIGKRVRFVGEADTGHVIGDINGTANGLLAWYGLRFTSPAIGVDVGFAKPIFQGSSSDGTLPIGFPVVTFTYRDVD